jgi:hypothetical protein
MNKTNLQHTFESELFTLTQSGDSLLIGSAVHGLGRTPTQVRAVLRCITTDPDSGWQPGDELEIPVTEDGDQAVYIASTSEKIEVSTNWLRPGQEALFYLPRVAGSDIAPVTSLSNFALKIYASI